MWGMAVKTASLLGRRMGFGSIAIFLTIMAGKAELRCLLFEQGRIFRSVPAVTGQAFALLGGCVSASCLLRHLIVAVQADHCRGFGQHAGIITAMYCVTRLAITFLDRTMLGR